MNREILERVAAARQAGNEATGEAPEGADAQEAPQEAAQEEIQEPKYEEQAEQEFQPDADQEAQEEIQVSTLNDLAEHLNVDVAELYKIKMPVSGMGDISIGEYKDQVQDRETYTRRAQELDTRAAELDRKAQEKLATWEAKIRDADAAFLIARKQLGLDESRVNWDKLKDEDPAEYASKKMEFMDRRGELSALYQQIYNEAQKLESERLENFHNQVNTLRREEKAKLKKWRPDWEQEDMNKIEKYLKSEGWPDELIKPVIEVNSSHYVKAAYKSMLYDELKAKGQEVKKEPKKGIPVLRAGKKVTAKDSKEQELDALRSRLKKSGRLKDAFALRRASRQQR